MLLDKKVEKRVKKYLLKMSDSIKTIRYESGAALHYAGTVPMGDDKFAVGTNGQMHLLKT